MLAREKDVPALNKMYDTVYAPAGVNQICGEFSTLYAMRPDYEGIVERAKQLQMDDLKIIYLVREPVSRAISHHYHMHSRHDKTRIESDINLCLKKYPRIIQYSQYAMQLEPWIAAYGKHKIKVICFEEYIKHRKQTVQEVREFLGLNKGNQQVQFDQVHNQSDGKPVLNSVWAHLTATPLYRFGMRPLMSVGLRDSIRSWLLPKAPPRPDLPTRESVETIIQQVSDDAQELQLLMQRDKPLWNFEEVRERLLSFKAKEQPRQRPAA